MKKTMTMLLTAAMILSMSVTAFAAEAKYSVSVDDDLLTVNNGETKATYQLEGSKLSLSKSNDGGIALSFRTEDDGGKKVTLGEQKDVSISGDIDYLNISQSKAYELAHRNAFPICRFDGSIRIPKASFLAWIETRTLLPGGLMPGA